MSKPTVIENIQALQLLGFLTKNGTECRFIHFTIKTPVEKIKVSQPYGQLYKIAQYRGYINANYQTGVEKRIAQLLNVPPKSVEYELGPSAYQHVLNDEGKATAVLVKQSNPNDGVYYLQFTKDETYQPTSVYVNEAGEVIADELVKPWLYKASPRNPLKPFVFSPKLSNIMEMRASGLILKAEDADEAKAALEDKK